MPKLLAQVNIGKHFWLRKEDGAGVGIGTDQAGEGYKTFWGFVSQLLPNIYTISGIILFILLFAGGFVIIVNAGNPEKQQQGGKAVTAAVVGFVVIFASFWLIQIIQQMTGVNILNPSIE